jgi:hypothetical protein
LSTEQGTCSRTEVSTCSREDGDEHQLLAFTGWINLGIGIKREERFVQPVCDFAIHGISALRSIDSDDKHRFMRLNRSVFLVTGCTLSIITVSGITEERVEQWLAGEDH